MQFLYWVEGQRGILTPKDMAGLGLGYAFEKTVSVAEMSGGPTQSHGLLVSADGQRMAYLPDQQTWRRIPPKHLGGRDGKVIYVGMWNEHQPTPAELCRVEQIAGQNIEINGQQWHVPIARSWDGQPQRRLPCVLSMDDDGEWISGNVESRFEKLWELACEWWDKKLASASFRFTWAFDAVVEVLRTNYRLGAVEVSLLGMIDDRCLMAQRVLDVVIDWATIVEWSKKNIVEHSGGSSTCGGGADSQTDTDQQ